MASNQRKKQLIRPALQLRICMTFIASSATGLTFMLAFALAFLEGIQIGGEEVLPTVMPKLMKAYWIAMSVTIPGTLAVGVMSTFLLAGPLHRFGMFLNDIIDGKKPEDCKLRTGDELNDFCELLNTATRPMRVAEWEDSKGESGPATESNTQEGQAAEHSSEAA